MPKPNYAFEKRQRELAKKQKKAEKAQRKSAGASSADAAGDAPAPDEVETNVESATGPGQRDSTEGAAEDEPDTASPDGSLPGQPPTVG